MTAALLLCLLGAAQAARHLQQGGNQPWYNQVRGSWTIACPCKAMPMAERSMIIL